jgi:hypothetical protein
MNATSNVTDKLTNRMDWALAILIGMFETGARGSAPPNEVFCCNIRRSRTFVRSMGFGWSTGMIWTMNAEVIAENKPA